MSINLIPLIVGVIGMVAAYIVFRAVMSYPAMEGKPQQIARQIQLGAMAFMSRELKLIVASVAVIAVAILLSPLG
jgi:K(+)-stimulated pyrophosphate-energized sodium pump